MTDLIITQSSKNATETFENNPLQWLSEQGATFILAKANEKMPIGKSWQNKPYSLEEAIAHSNKGGNVGVLVGQHSNGIIIIDIDTNYEDQIQKLRGFGFDQTAKVIRSNASDRAKLFYRIDGELPKSTNNGSNPPEVELLSNGKQGIVAPSKAKGGCYELIDTDFGVMELTTQKLNMVWKLLTDKELNSSESTVNEINKYRAEGSKFTDDKVGKIKSHWNTLKVFEHFGFADNGTKDEGNQIRLPKNGGLLIDKETDLWFCHSEGVGGDQLDAWAYCNTGKVLDRRDSRQFLDTLDEMAKVAGLDIPEFSSKGRKPKLGKTSEIKEALEMLDYTFSLNVLENEVYVNGEAMTDIVEDKIHTELYEMGITNFTLMSKVFNTLAGENPFHPIVDYFNNLKWDGKDHLEELFKYLKLAHKEVTYSNGEVKDFNRAAFRKWMLGVVTQIMEVDKKSVIRFQNPMLVLSGAQEAGKSTFARWLCPIDSEKYHNEGSVDPHNIEDHRLAVSKILWEVTELGATIRKADKDALKGFLTQTTSTYRPPWGKKPITKPRIVSYIGTINPELGFLNDVTGERRFLPVEVESIDWAYKSNIDINQLWGQIFQLYKNGERPNLTKEEKQMLIEVQADHKIDDPLITLFQKVFVVDPEQTDWKMHTSDIAIAFNDSPHTRAGMLPNNVRLASAPIANVLMALGLQQSKNMRIDGVQGKGYEGIKEKGLAELSNSGLEAEEI